MMANLTSEYFISGLGTLCIRVCAWVCVCVCVRAQACGCEFLEIYHHKII